MAGGARADDALHLSGFATLGLGKAISGAHQSNFEFDCPCYIANYPDVGIYRNSWSLKPDSRAGVQATYKLGSQFSVTGQLTANASADKPAKFDKDPYPSTYKGYPTRLTVVKNVTIFDGEGGRFDNGTVVLSSGKIDMRGLQEWFAK